MIDLPIFVSIVIAAELQVNEQCRPQHRIDRLVTQLPSVSRSSLVFPDLDTEKTQQHRR
jgi:hypothetical protein